MSTIALAHHWLVGMRGGERVLEQMCALFPSAPIHTLVARLDRLSDNLRAHPVIPSPLQGFPGATRHYKKLLPLFGLAIPQMRVARGTRLVFSSDASMIKGLRVPKGVPHVCYCHSPPRYLWDMQETYERGTAGLGPIGRFVFRCTVPPARRFDISAASKVTHFIANSEFVRERIKRIYGREAVVIYPPVDVEAFDPSRPRSDFYLVVSELTAYKRVDLAVEAFRGSDRRLVVIGDGPEMKALREAATENITFMGRQPFPVLKEHFETCRAFLFPGVEDFGIAPCEAQAAGAPVIAYGVGGALETVREWVTGLFFREQSVAALLEALEQFESVKAFDPAVCRANVEHLRSAAFRLAIRQYLEAEFPDLFRDFPWPENVFT